MTDILKGITVLDLTQNIAGPFCTQLLGDFGADVIKVERPEGGDDARKWLTPSSHGIGTAFLAVNRNKRSIGIDIALPQGRDVVRRLADKADVLVHAVRPGSMEARGLGYDDLQTTNPRLVYCSISAFGETGPLARDPGYDPLIQAFTGIMSVTGHPDRPPARAGVSVIDMGTGMWGFIGILAALYQRKETGRGARVSTSLMETGVNWMSLFLAHYMGAGFIGQRMGDVTPMTSPYEAFKTSDGAVLITAGNDKLFTAVCDALGLQGLPSDPRFDTNVQRVANRDILHALLEKSISQMRSADCVALLRAAGAPCAPINSVDAVEANEQVAAMRMIQPLPAPHVPDLRTVDLPVSIDGAKASLRHAPPPLAAHTDQVLQWTGYTKAEIASLKASLAVG
ncbi:CaiB/BaiF CoA transferase family protein [Piscinibacter sakaiensis]|uniref:CaiB/BaiF CoA transferase family protein n=1 Tax=Piscinibacter sakaiensis TaxID=1547922 RepID=UPI003AAD053B